VDCAWHPLGAGTFLAVLTSRSLSVWACAGAPLPGPGGAAAQVACGLRVDLSGLAARPASLAFGAAHRFVGIYYIRDTGGKVA
jgi:hypothetical protein